MAAIGGRRYVRRLAEAMKRAAKLGHDVYIAETARTWELFDDEPAGGFRGRRWERVGERGPVGSVRSS